MKLYYSPGACSLATDIVLHELGVDAQFVKVDLKSKKTESGDDFNAVNPKGYVPALILDDGDLLTENIAILQYLATLRSSLLPQEGKAKWHAIETLAFVSTEIHKAFKPVFDPTSSDEDKKKAKERVAMRLGTLEKKLDGEFIFGRDFSVVDAYLFVMLMWAKKNGVTIPAKLAAYQEKLGTRASVKAALQMEGLAQKS